MRPIILVLAVAIAGAGLGVGFLNAPSIDVTSQDIGIGHDTMTAPIDTAYIAFDIKAIPGNQGFFKNVYDNCIFMSADPVSLGSTIFCKLTDMQGKVVGEGNRILGADLPPMSKTLIPIQTKISTGSLFVDNIADVTIVVLGPI